MARNVCLDCWISYKNKLYIISFEKHLKEIFIESIGDTCSPELNYISIYEFNSLDGFTHTLDNRRTSSSRWY